MNDLVEDKNVKLMLKFMNRNICRYRYKKINNHTKLNMMNQRY